MGTHRKVSIEQLLHAIDLLILDEFDELERLEQEQREVLDRCHGSGWQQRHWEPPAYRIEA